VRGAGGTIGTSLSQEALEIYKAKCSKTAKRPRRSACLAEKAEFAHCMHSCYTHTHTHTHIHTHTHTHTHTPTVSISTPTRRSCSNYARDLV
jgi:hypothetical protein